MWLPSYQTGTDILTADHPVIPDLHTPHLPSIPTLSKQPPDTSHNCEAHSYT